MGRVEVETTGSGEACGQLKEAGPTSEHSSSKSFKTLCQPSKIWLQHSVVICPLAQSVTPGSSPSLSKRGLPSAAYCGNKPEVLCLARASWLDLQQSPDPRSKLDLLLGTGVGHQMTTQLLGEGPECHMASGKADVRDHRDS